eukprot:scaffold13207_cov111-Skeletonema_dohrnii-CCMP3373.AAC.2
MIKIKGCLLFYVVGCWFCLVPCALGLVVGCWLLVVAWDGFVSEAGRGIVTCHVSRVMCHTNYSLETRGSSVEKGELKPGGARAVPEDACGACWVRVGRRRWMANALMQARPNCWRKWILGVGCSVGVAVEFPMGGFGGRPR